MFLYGNAKTVLDLLKHIIHDSVSKTMDNHDFLFTDIFHTFHLKELKVKELGRLIG